MKHLRYTTVFALTFAAAVCAAQSMATRPLAPKTGIDVLRAMHDRYASTWYSTVSFWQTTDQRTADGAFKSEKWYEELKLPGQLRIDVGVPATDTTTKRKIILFTNGNLYVHVPGKPLEKTARLNLLLVLGFDVYKQSVDKTAAELRSEGFDLSRVHKDVWQGRPVYVVGAASGDLKSKQFWVDAQRLLFVRMIDPLQTSSGGQTTEALFKRYRPLAGGWIAMEVQANRNGVMQFHEKYANVKANVNLPDSLFDPATLK